MPKKKQDNLLQEIRKENIRLDEFINNINSQIKKTDEKLARAIIGSDIKTMKLYQSILQN